MCILFLGDSKPCCFLFTVFLDEDRSCISITEASACFRHFLFFSCDKWFIVMFGGASVGVMSMLSRIFFSRFSSVWALVNFERVASPSHYWHCPNWQWNKILEGSEIFKALNKQIVRSSICLHVTCDLSCVFVHLGIIDYVPAAGERAKDKVATQTAEILSNKYAGTGVAEECLMLGLYFYNTKAKIYTI